MLWHHLHGYDYCRQAICDCSTCTMLETLAFITFHKKVTRLLRAMTHSCFFRPRSQVRSPTTRSQEMNSSSPPAPNQYRHVSIWRSQPSSLLTLPFDIINHGILPRLSSTDLVLLLFSVPQMATLIENILQQRHSEQLKASPSIVRTARFQEQRVPPRIAPTSGSFIAHCDTVDSTLQISSVETFGVFATVAMNNVYEVVSLSVTQCEQYVIAIRETIVDVFALQAMPTSSSVSLTMCMTIELDVPRSAGAYRPPGTPPIECGLIKTSSSSSGGGNCTLAVAHVIDFKFRNIRALKISTTVQGLQVNRSEHLKPAGSVSENENFGSGKKDATILQYYQTPLCKWGVEAERHDQEFDQGLYVNNIILKCSNPTAILNDVQLVAEPCRLFLPSSVLGECASLVNPTTNNSGPWCKQFPLDCPDFGVMASSSVSPCEQYFHIVRSKLKSGVSMVTVERHLLQCGTMAHFVSMPLPSDRRVLNTTHASDGRLSVVFFGHVGNDALLVDGWFVVDVENGSYIMTNKAQGERTTTFTYENSFAVSKDGQMVSLTRDKKAEDASYEVEICDSATGICLDVVTEMDCDDSAAFNQCWKEPLGPSACVNQFIDGVPNGFVGSTSSGQSFLFSVRM